MVDFQFDYKNCNVDVYQIENGDLYHIELFPDNQTTDSFESCEYSGVFNVKSLLTNEYSHYEFLSIIDHTPDNISEIDYENIFDIVRYTITHKLGIPAVLLK